MSAPSAAPGAMEIDVLGYRARLQAGLIARIAAETATVARAHAYAVITDENVARHWLAAVEDSFRANAAAARVIARAIPPGESYKTRDTWTRLSDWMLDAGCGRDSTVIALGGGVVGDVAGFVAATYMRGVPVVNVPTTLLAMVDASIGGKTGVDTPAGKNLVGAFHQPAAVLVDPGVLATLPPEQLRAGMAEVLKHGAITSRTLFDDAARFAAGVQSALALGTPIDWRGADALQSIGRSIAVKAGIVRRDERESGIRQLLNAGHTVAHAIERVTAYRCPHGEAVAIGLVAESHLAERAGVARPGTADRIAEAMAAAGLPRNLPAGVSGSTLVGAMQTDKKVRGGQLTFALLAGVGEPAGSDERGWTIALDRSAVSAWLDELDAREAMPVTDRRE